MILTQEYSRVASSSTRAWLISPDGKIHDCGTGEHEDYVLEHPDEFGGGTIHDLMEESWIRVGMLVNSLYIESLDPLTRDTLNTIQEFAKGIDTPFNIVEIHIWSKGMVHMSKKEFLWASIKDINRSSSRVAISGSDNRAWLISPQGKVHPCGDDHETYVYQHPEEFEGEYNGMISSYALVEAGWTRVGVIGGIFFVHIKAMLTSRNLDLLQELAKETPIPYKQVQIHKDSGSSNYFDPKEFQLVSLKDVNRRGLAQYAKRHAAIEDHRGRIYGPDEKVTDYFDIGHGPLGIKRSYYIWAWIKGQLDVKGPYTSHWGESPDHVDIWGEESMYSAYRGRYDELTGEVSVVVPDRWQHRDIPDALTSRLEQQFKPKSIHLF
jgi:hypothetical protein